MESHFRHLLSHRLTLFNAKTIWEHLAVSVVGLPPCVELLYSYEMNTGKLNLFIANEDHLKIIDNIYA